MYCITALLARRSTPSGACRGAFQIIFELVEMLTHFLTSSRAVVKKGEAAALAKTRRLLAGIGHDP